MNAPLTRRALLGAVAGVGAVALPPVALTHDSEALLPEGDALLLELIERHAKLTVAWDRASFGLDAAADRAHAAYPARPEALYRPISDHAYDLGGAGGHARRPGGTVRCFYSPDDVERLRTAGTVTRVSYTVDGEPGPMVPDDAGEARRRAILAAHDGWVEERAIVDRRVGLDVAEAVAAPIIDALQAAETQIRAFLPSTLSGVQAKARWITSDCRSMEEALAFVLQLAGEPMPSDVGQAVFIFEGAA